MTENFVLIVSITMALYDIIYVVVDTLKYSIIAHEAEHLLSGKTMIRISEAKLRSTG